MCDTHLNDSVDFVVISKLARSFSPEHWKLGIQIDIFQFPSMSIFVGVFYSFKIGANGLMIKSNILKDTVV